MITIIGILAALITVAAVGALKAMQRTRIKAEINEVSSGLDEYKNKVTAYPPNCQTDASGPLIESEVLNDVKRHIKQIAPRGQESDDLARVLTGQAAVDSTSYPPASTHSKLVGGITSAEAVPFWLGGFSSDPKYPISGDNGGPSYSIPGQGTTGNNKLDPIESRKWVYPFDVTRLGPRDSDGYFNGRFIEYKAPNGAWRRINFWTYTPAKSQQPLLYFDTSRHPIPVKNGNLYAVYDPPASTASDPGDLGQVFAFKKIAETQATAAPLVQYINPDRFQIIHCGIDDAWDVGSFNKMGIPRGNNLANNLSNIGQTMLLFPTGPFVGEMADTEVNFVTETTIEDAQK